MNEQTRESTERGARGQKGWSASTEEGVELPRGGGVSAEWRGRGCRAGRGNFEGRVHETRADTQVADIYVRPYGDIKAPGFCRGEPVCSPCPTWLSFAGWTEPGQARGPVGQPRGGAVTTPDAVSFVIPADATGGLAPSFPRKKTWRFRSVRPIFLHKEGA